jgi:sugar phosphate isomerase/epimerase
MRLAYNTNGLAHHDVLDAIDLVADIGYQGIAITIDHGTLNPYSEHTAAQLKRVADKLNARRLERAIETGGRFLLDPRQKHEPTLLTADSNARAVRIDFLNRAIAIAARLGARCVSLWSGVVRDGAGQEEALHRLVESLRPVAEEASSRGVMLGFEPEPGMLIDTVDRYNELLNRLADRGVDTSSLGLTIDVGHLHCLGDLPISQRIRASRDRLINVHIEDMRAGIHEHLPFGEGEIDFPPVIAALAEIGYDGLVSVELSRHSHEGPQAARQAYNFLRPLAEKATGA